MRAGQNIRSRDTTGPGSAAPFAAEEEGRATQTDSHSTIFELLDLLFFFGPLSRQHDTHASWLPRERASEIYT